MKKLFTSTFLVLVLLAMTAGTAFAQDTTPITGAVQTVTTEVNAATGETIVVVTLLDETTNTTQTVKISLATAELLELVSVDADTGEVTILETGDKVIEIDPTTVIPDVIPEEDTEEAQHPVGSALSDFFGELLGVDYETIMNVHDEGVGFGVIAQALWLSNSLDGGSATFEALIAAKQSGDYSAITLADGSTPNNWGAVVRSLRKGDNLGSVMSGKAKNSLEDTDDLSARTHKAPGSSNKDKTNKSVGHGNSDKNGNGNSDNNNGNGNNGNNNGNGGNNNGNGNGNGNSNGNGNGH